MTAVAPPSCRITSGVHPSVSGAAPSPSLDGGQARRASRRCDSVVTSLPLGLSQREWLAPTFWSAPRADRLRTLVPRLMHLLPSLRWADECAALSRSPSESMRVPVPAVGGGRRRRRAAQPPAWPPASRPRSQRACEWCQLSREDTLDLRTVSRPLASEFEAARDQPCRPCVSSEPYRLSMFSSVLCDCLRGTAGAFISTVQHFVGALFAAHTYSTSINQGTATPPDTTHLCAHCRSWPSEPRNHVHHPMREAPKHGRVRMELWLHHSRARHAPVAV